MRAVILIDNISNTPDLTPEWGLSIYIEYEGRKYLLDTGASELFAKNAEVLGIDLSQVDFGILSHAHHDHSDGMDTFFEQNAKADFWLRHPSKENCYGSKEMETIDYIGIKKGILDTFKDRIQYAEGKVELAPKVYLLGHTTPDLDYYGQLYRMFLKIGDQYQYDDFRHEQSLIFDTDQGLVVFNSCCHAGADTILMEAAQAFPGKKVHAIIGGFHLFESPAHTVREFGQRLQATGVEHVVTGHCTGQEAYDILKDMLGDKAQQMECGLVLEF